MVLKAVFPLTAAVVIYRQIGYNPVNEFSKISGASNNEIKDTTTTTTSFTRQQTRPLHPLQPLLIRHLPQSLSV